MNYMYIALASGLLVGWWLFSGTLAGVILTLIYHFKYKDEDSYLNLYDVMDTEFNFEMMKVQKNAPKSYTEFLRQHQAARLNVYTYLTANRAAYRKLVLVRCLFIAVPAVIFWNNWYYYAGSVLIVLLGTIAYKRFIKHNTANFYRMLVQITLISENQKQKRK